MVEQIIGVKDWREDSNTGRRRGGCLQRAWMRWQGIVYLGLKLIMAGSMALKTD